MSIHSAVVKVGQVKFPRITDVTQVYMHPMMIGEKIDLPKGAESFTPVVESMLAMLDSTAQGKAFVTIDRRTVFAGKTHRRPGPHVDGNFIYEWHGGGGWLTGEAGRFLEPHAHKLQYCNPLGGMLIASDHKACRVWTGRFEGEPNQGGDCSHLQSQLNKAPTFLMEEKALYLGNSTCIHESLPVERDVFRTLVRITLPADLKVF
jgi:hypothetical protein